MTFSFFHYYFWLREKRKWLKTGGGHIRKLLHKMYDNWRCNFDTIPAPLHYREFSNERTRVERRETFRKLRMKENFSKAFEGYFQWIIRAGEISNKNKQLVGRVRGLKNHALTDHTYHLHYYILLMAVVLSSLYYYIYIS